MTVTDMAIAISGTIITFFIFIENITRNHGDERVGWVFTKHACILHLEKQDL